MVRNTRRRTPTAEPGSGSPQARGRPWLDRCGPDQAAPAPDHTIALLLLLPLATHIDTVFPKCYASARDMVYRLLAMCKGRQSSESDVEVLVDEYVLHS